MDRSTPESRVRTNGRNEPVPDRTQVKTETDSAESGDGKAKAVSEKTREERGRKTPNRTEMVQW